MREIKFGLKGAIGETFASFFQEKLTLPTEEDLLERQYNARANTVVAVRFLSMLLIVTLITQQVSKKLIVRPIVDHIRVGGVSQIFLNAEMKQEAIHELRFYEKSLRFEALLDSDLALSAEEKQVKVNNKALEIAEDCLKQSRDALSNRFADLIALGTFLFIFFTHRDEKDALRLLYYDLLETLSDSAKAFILILSTDIFVGFHSAHGWEVLLDWLAHHLGVAANHALIFLFIATVPVILDTIIKYGIFQSPRLSPTTVAAFKEMNH